MGSEHKEADTRREREQFANDIATLKIAIDALLRDATIIISDLARELLIAAPSQVEKPSQALADARAFVDGMKKGLTRD